jgi:dTDP-4-dehydrorhamnose reductase
MGIRNNEQMKIILTGASGLIGSRFEELMFENHEIIPLSSGNGIDITDKDAVKSFLSEKNGDVIIHLAGKTDVDGCEADKDSDLGILNIEEAGIDDLDVLAVNSDVWKNKSSAFAVNTVGTKNLYDISKEIGTKFVYISTDFVFSGDDDFNTEETHPQPIDWYGYTKYFGEKLIDTSKDLIVRLSFPYGFKSPVKKDLVWKLYDLLSSNSEVSLISNQTITPTFIDDIINGLNFILQKEAVGTFHLTGSSSLTPKEIGEKIKNSFGFQTVINDSKLEDVYAGKAPRPFKSIMKNARIINLGYRPKTFDEGLELIKSSG